MKNINIIFALIVLLNIASCTNKVKNVEYVDTTWLTEKDTFLTPEILADSLTKVEIRTPFGMMLAVLYNETPLHKANFIKLAKEGFYDSTLFHRIIKEFMIQGGDPKSKGADSGIRLGEGGPGYTIPAEMHKHIIHKKGALSAARMSDQVNPKKESSGSQFYIVHGMKYNREMLTTNFEQIFEYLGDPKCEFLRKRMKDVNEKDQKEMFTKVLSFKDTLEKMYEINLNVDYPVDRLNIYSTIGGTPNLDDNYTVFGQIIKGLDVIDKLASLRVDNSDRPLKNVPMMIKIIE